MSTRLWAHARITINNGCVLQVVTIERVERDRVATSALLRACSAMDRVRRASSTDVEVAAERLLPRGRHDLAVGAADPSGALAAVANANLMANTSDEFEIGILVSPVWRGRGLAASLLQAIPALLPSYATASGVIDRDNMAALSLLGLAPTASVTIDPDSVTFRVTVPASPFR